VCSILGIPLLCANRLRVLQTYICLFCSLLCVYFVLYDFLFILYVLYVFICFLCVYIYIYTQKPDVQINPTCRTNTRSLFFSSIDIIWGCTHARCMRGAAQHNMQDNTWAMCAASMRETRRRRYDDDGPTNMRERHQPDKTG
jgi:Ca2+/Na+ antiporter